MGVPWGIQTFPATVDAEQLIAEWSPLAMPARFTRKFALLHGTDRYVLQSRARTGPEVTKEPAPEVAAAVTAANRSAGDGTYGWFGRLVDGVETFVPWQVFSPVKITEACPFQGLLCHDLTYLLRSMRHTLAPPQAAQLPAEVVTLAGNLLKVGRVAKQHKLMLRIGY